MRELREILARSAALGSGESAVLATVVDVKGSSYRLPGAKMLVLEDGSFFGTVSGGCVEADVLERAARVRESGVPEVFLYDTTGDEDSVFSLNMGCRGIVRVLLEKIERESPYVEFLRGCYEGGSAGYAATRVGKGSTGARAFYDDKGRLAGGTAPPPGIDSIIKNIASSPAAGRRPSSVEIADDGDEVFVEKCGPPPRLLICGAGADAIPLADIAHRVGWRVSIADHRPAYAAAARFPDVDSIVVSRPEKLLENVKLEAVSAAVVMSHNFNNDKEYIRQLIPSGLQYVGALGPGIRTEELLSELGAEGAEFNTDQLSKLHAPVGLDIGGADPETIAVSIIAEIQSVMSGRQGGFLKRRGKPIYDR